MRFASIALLLSAVTLLAAPAGAQRERGFGPGAGPGAEFFLARVGDLRLTDAQVVRLAAIARRSADRRRATRAAIDSLAPARRGAARMDSTDRAARLRELDRVRTRFARDREQARADLRDALAVLTPDQQATAWEMVSRGGRPDVTGARGERSRRSVRSGRDRRPGGPDRREPPGAQRPPR